MMKQAKPKKLIGITGPSSFSSEVMKMVEDFLDANFVLLYHNNFDNLKEWMEELDGVILAGGVDIHPTVYGSNVHNFSNLSRFNIERDKRELFIIDYCMKFNLPLLGICRGHQLIGVYHGMELYQDITDASVSHTPNKHNVNLENSEPCHSVFLCGDKTKEFFNSTVPTERQFLQYADKEYDKSYIWVNSYHHQALKYTKVRHEKVSVCGISKTGLKDCPDIIEFMSVRDKNCLSVQWHPELDYTVNTPSRKILEKFKSYLTLESTEGKPE